MAPKINDRLLNCNDPEGAYLLGRFEAWGELIEVIRTSVELLEGATPDTSSVCYLLTAIVGSHDRMVESINSDGFTPGANEAKEQHAFMTGYLGALAAKGPYPHLTKQVVEAFEQHVDDLPDFDPDAQDNPYAMPEEG